MGTIEKLERIASDEAMVENFVINLVNQIYSDEEKPERKFAQLKAAYEKNPELVNDLMLTLCGWSMDTLCDQVTED
jgi:hypothetical protein